MNLADPLAVKPSGGTDTRWQAIDGFIMTCCAERRASNSTSLGWLCRDGQTFAVQGGEVRFSTDDEVFARAAERFTVETARISNLVPDADVQHVGGTAVRGCRTKGVGVPSSGVTDGSTT